MFHLKNFYRMPLNHLISEYSKIHYLGLNFQINQYWGAIRIRAKVHLRSSGIIFRGNVENSVLFSLSHYYRFPDITLNRRVISVRQRIRVLVNIGIILWVINWIIFIFCESLIAKIYCKVKRPDLSFGIIILIFICQ